MTKKQKLSPEGNFFGSSLAQAKKIARVYIDRFRTLYPGHMTQDCALFLTEQMAAYLHTRNTRAVDVSSPEAQEAASIEAALYPKSPPRILNCVDGRVHPGLVAGMHSPPIRVPAGNSSEFLPMQDGSTLFLRQGMLARELNGWLSKTGRGFIVLDSHLYCAKREHDVRDEGGRDAQDGGLLRDVLRKREMSVALLNYVLSHTPRTKLSCFQVSFNPETGFAYCGLERNEAIFDSQAQKFGFIQPVLERLASDGVILSTKLWVEKNEKLRALLEAHAFDLDYEKEFRQSTLMFWRNFAQMYQKLIGFAREKVRGICWDADEETVTERATFLLANAYTGFLLNKKEGGNPYKQHKESVIVVSSGDRGPYDQVHAFGVSPYHPDISGSIQFLRFQVLSNRRNRMTTPSEQHLAQRHFVRISDYLACPVPVVFMEKLPVDIGKENEEAIRTLPWTEIVLDDWPYVSQGVFRDRLRFYLKDKGACDQMEVILECIDTLRLKAFEMVKPEMPAAADFIQGKILPLWILRSQNNEALALIPFFLLGYSPEYF